MYQVCRILIQILFLVLICYTRTYADFGVKMGIISSEFEVKILNPVGGTVDYFDETRIGPTTGIFFQHFNNRYFNIESELIYLQKGGQEKFEITTLNQPNGTGEVLINDIQFDYLSLQSSIRPNYSYQKVNVYLLAGGSVSYLLGVKGGLRPKSDFNSTGFGYLMGFGIEFQDVLKIPILVEVMMNADLNSIYENSEIEYKQKVYLLRIGFKMADLTP